VHDAIGCKTVFATHYHELTQLADELPAVRNFNVAVREVGDRVLFLHRLQPGGADRSYGIEVGRLAGLPAPVLARAKEVLALLEGEQLVKGLGARGSGLGIREPLGAAASGVPKSASPEPRASSPDQLTLFSTPAPPHPVVERLKAVDANHLTPMQALELVAKLAEEARKA
jgi:DNA mismatch repair protein MutS